MDFFVVVDGGVFVNGGTINKDCFYYLFIFLETSGGSVGSDPIHGAEG